MRRTPAASRKQPYELSDASGVKLNTVRTWLRRSLMQLRECLSR